MQGIHKLETFIWWIEKGRSSCFSYCIKCYLSFPPLSSPPWPSSPSFFFLPLLSTFHPFLFSFPFLPPNLAFFLLLLFFFFPLLLLLLLLSLPFFFFPPCCLPHSLFPHLPPPIWVYSKKFLKNEIIVPVLLTLRFMLETHIKK